MRIAQLQTKVFDRPIDNFLIRFPQLSLLMAKKGAKGASCIKCKKNRLL